MGTPALPVPIPRRAVATSYAAPNVLAHVCVRPCVCPCPLLCREAVPVTQAKQVNGHQGHSYAASSVCHDSVTAF